MTKTLVIALLASASLLGCKKAEDKATAHVDDQGGMMPKGSAEPTPTPAGSAAAAPVPAPAAGGVTSSAEYMTKGGEMIAKILDLFKETDCDKLAANLTSFIEANRAEIDALDAWEKGHPVDKTAMDKASEPKMKDFQKTIEKCKASKAFQDALAKIPQ